ncbi:KH domain-containing protein [bacterium]|nr:KH domain-containing protein [bacterium]
MKDFVEFIAKNLVDYPEEVEVRTIDGEKTIVFELSVNKSDIGKIIGKNGRTIRAIRTLLTTTAAKHGQRAVLEILE